MKAERFNEIVAEQLDICNSMLVKKAEEYADDIDRLHNFKQAGTIQQIKPKQALAGFMAKHTVSIYDMLADDGDYSTELWEEKITDHINYLLLLKGLIEEEKSEVRLVMDGLPGLQDISTIQLYNGRHHQND